MSPPIALLMPAFAASTAPHTLAADKALEPITRNVLDRLSK